MTPLLLKSPLYAVSPEWECNGYDDSDFYRVMYNPDTHSLDRVLTWTTRAGCGYDMTVTAAYAEKNNLFGHYAHEYKRDFDGNAEFVKTDNIRVSLPVKWFVPHTETPDAVWDMAEQAYAELVFRQLQADDKLKARQPGKGKSCLVVNGRKIKKGTTVRVLGNPEHDIYQGHNNGFRVLVTTATGALKTNLRNLEVIVPEQYETPETELRNKARAIAREAREHKSFYRLFRTSAVSLVV